MKNSILLFLFLVLASTNLYAQSSDYVLTRSMQRTEIESYLTHPLMAPVSVHSDESSCELPNGEFGVKLWYDRKGRTIEQDWHYEITVSLVRRTLSSINPPIATVQYLTEKKVLRIDEIRAENLQTYIHRFTFEKDNTGNPFDINASTNRNAVLYIEDVNFSPNAPEDIYLDMEYFKNGQDELLMDYNLKFGSNVKNDQLQLVWDYLPGAEEYDLEWVYIDEYSNFRTTYPNPTQEDPFTYQEPTRITTTDQHFVLEMNYPQGVVYFRVRGVGHYENYPDQPRYTPWHYGIEKPVKFEINEAYEGKKIWQSVTTYAEEGKYKKVISYLDGSMRSRQVVTHLNTDNLALVAETRYDYEGRGVVQILPVPLEKEENEMVASLHYRNNLNRFEITSGHTTGYEKSLYDNGQKELATLVHEPDPAHPNDKGVGLYYSKYNTLNTIHRDYLPDANGYAFTQVVYDNEGRVKSQGGVGELFQYDTENNDRRSTEYFYANTNETELRRMFGKNVGKSSHYRKQAVRDANGQISVSYMDQAGNVIATALAGESPEMLLALDKDTDEQLSTINVSLDANNRIDLENHTSISTNEILNVTPNTAYIINYKMGGEDAQVEFEGVNFCENCKYELNVYIYTPKEEKISIIENQEIGGDACENAPKGEFSFEEKIVFKEVGVYTLIKELTIKKESIAEIRRRIEESDEFKNMSDLIIAEYINNVDYTNCEVCVEENCVDGVTDIEQWHIELQETRCENIEAQILDWVNKDPSTRTMQDHPEYCHLEDCNLNAPSTIREQKMSLIKTWNDAKALGYTKPFNTTLSIPSVPITDYDPYFTNPDCYGYQYPASSTKMDQFLSNVAVDENGNSLNAWQAAFAAAANQTSIVNIPEEQLQWQFFYGYYIQAKNKLHKEILLSKGCLYAASQGEEDPIVVDPVLPITPQEQNEFFNENFPPLNCQQQVATWMEQIYALCDDLTETQKTDIQANLEAYCAITNDGGNFYGFLYYEECDDAGKKTASTSSKINPILAQNFKTDPKTQELIKSIQEDKQKLDLQQGTIENPFGGGLNPIDPIKDPKGKGGTTISTELNDCLCYQRYEATYIGLNGQTTTGYPLPNMSANSPCYGMQGFNELRLCASGIKEISGQPYITWNMLDQCGLNCTPPEPQEQPDCICQLTEQYNGIVPYEDAVSCLRDNRDYFMETFGGDGNVNTYIKSCVDNSVLVEINGQEYINMAELELCLKTSFGCAKGNLCDLGYAGTVVEIKALLGYTQRPNNTDQSDKAKMARCIWDLDDAQTITLEQLEQCAGVVLDCPQATGCNISGNQYLDNVRDILATTTCTTTFNQIVVDNPCKTYLVGEQRTQQTFKALKIAQTPLLNNQQGLGLYAEKDPKIRSILNLPTAPAQHPVTFEAYVKLDQLPIQEAIWIAGTPDPITGGPTASLYYRTGATIGRIREFTGMADDMEAFIYVNQYGQVAFRWSTTYSGLGNEFVSQGQIQVGECAHIAVMYTINEVKIYINGQLQNFQSTGSTPNWPGLEDKVIVTIGSKEEIGSGNNGDGTSWKHYSYPFPGTIQEVKLWKEERTFTPGIVASDLVLRNAHTYPTLVGYWPMNEGEGKTLRNLAANQAHAFIKNNDFTLDWQLPTQCIITDEYLERTRVCAEYDQTVLDAIFPTFPTLAELEEKCKDELKEIAILQAKEEIQKLLDKKQEEFLQNYYAECFAGDFNEKLNYKYAPSEYHYTLYYYDQAGSLVQTVPPKGVQLLTEAQIAANQNPAHRMRTRYRYNSLGQPRWQDTPDGGTSTFVYDDLGQLRLSQNAEQALHGQYSYTKFDNESRTIEVGQIKTTESLSQLETAMNDLQTGASFPALGYEKTEITRTFYDFAPETDDPSIEQTYLGGRIAATLVQEDGETTGTRSLYSYGIHGNIIQLWQQLPELTETKTLTYDYDLVSGNVNEVNYQKGKADEFNHRYYYDADNRMTSVETSHDGYIWDEDAKYQYYAHGSIARTEVGEYKVQAMDHIYTLQGQRKGVNQFEESPTTTEKYKYVSQKTASYALHYYKGDYQSIEGHSWTANNTTDLFNGNVVAMSTNLSQLGNLTRTYRYDQLDRIRESNNADGTLGYKETFTYDANGNILTNTLHNKAGQQIDNAIYNYIDATNKNLLGHISDPQHGEHHAGFDLMHQTAGNFEYNDIGNLKKDEAMDVEKIEWTAYYKRSKITKEDGTTITYRYDAKNNCIYKKIEQPTGETQTTHYIKDINGATISTYNEQIVKEFTIYGTARVGSYNTQTKKGKQTLGNKKYELSNHLKNVLSVYTDNKYGSSTGSKADNYTAFVISQTDYLSFGAITIGYSFENEEYHYYFNGKELDKSTGWQDYGFRDYNPVYKRFDRVDPLSSNYPFYTPYQFAGNSPLTNTDLDGLEPENATHAYVRESGSITHNFQFFQWDSQFSKNPKPRGTDIVTITQERVVEYRDKKDNVVEIKTYNITMTAYVDMNGGITYDTPRESVTTQKQIGTREVLDRTTYRYVNIPTLGKKSAENIHSSYTPTGPPELDMYLNTVVEHKKTYKESPLVTAARENEGVANTLDKANFLVGLGTTAVGIGGFIAGIPALGVAQATGLIWAGAGLALTASGYGLLAVKETYFPTDAENIRLETTYSTDGYKTLEEAKTLDQSQTIQTNDK